MRENTPSNIPTSFTLLLNMIQQHRTLTSNLPGGSHIPYHNIKITIPAKNVEQVYAYPPFMGVQNNGDTYTITGSAAADENVAVELLTTVGGLSGIPGIRTQVADLNSKTASGSFWYNLPYFVANLLNILAKAGVILVPVLLIYLYYHYGREKMFTIPEYLSTIPNPALKPWQVNLLFKDDALDFDEDGYYATLLELHRRKIIQITEKGAGKALRSRFFQRQHPIPTNCGCLHLFSNYQRIMFLTRTKLKHWQRKRRPIILQKKRHCNTSGCSPM